MYIHELDDWPTFTWDNAAIALQLAEVRHYQGRLIGRMESLGFPLRQEAVLDSLTHEVQKSSEIEGERLDQKQVRSSIARRLGIEVGTLPVPDWNVEGVVEMMLDATQNFSQPITEERLFAWHAALFPTGRSGMNRILVGAWRDDRLGPMQVVSGRLDRPKVHYQAPTADRLHVEMARYKTWFNNEKQVEPVLKAALAHLWFVTIHPFDDGNGRIARAIAEMALARSEGSSQRFYSMSAQIRLERKAYYDILERTQKGTLDITPWMSWFLACLDRAISASEASLTTVLYKARFWESHAADALNGRQRLMLTKLLDGFNAKLTSSKWAKIAKCSQDTASRDINDLIAKGILRKDNAGGRSTSYSLAQESRPT